MKYRLSTILLLIACIALALGWYVDRHKRNTDQLVSGTAALQRSLSFRILDTAKPTELAKEVERQQVLGVLSLFSSAESVRQATR